MDCVEQLHFGSNSVRYFENANTIGTKLTFVGTRVGKGYGVLLTSGGVSSCLLLHSYMQERSVLLVIESGEGRRTRFV